MSTITCWKVLTLLPDGRLMSPMSPVDSVWSGPLLRAHEFDRSSRVPEAPGIHALRYGEHAMPVCQDMVIARCEVPPGTAAVMSPWALRAERLLVTGLRFMCRCERVDRATDYWRRHCDILPRLERMIGMSPELEYRAVYPDFGCWLIPGYLQIWSDGPSFPRPGRTYMALATTQSGWRAVYDRHGQPLLHYAGQGNPEVARRWRELLTEYASTQPWPDELTAGWRQYLAGIELGVY